MCKTSCEPHYSRGTARAKVISDYVVALFGQSGGDSVQVIVTCRRIRVKLSFLSGVFQNDSDIASVVIVVVASRELGSSFPALVAVTTDRALFSKVNVTADTIILSRATLPPRALSRSVLESAGQRVQNCRGTAQRVRSRIVKGFPDGQKGPKVRDISLCGTDHRMTLDDAFQG